MKHIAAAKAKNHFGYLLDMAQRNPVLIEKKGRGVAVVISLQDYERLEQIEDQMWAKRAMEAEKEGFIGEEASKKLLDDLSRA